MLYEGGACEAYGVLKVSHNRGDKPPPHSFKYLTQPILPLIDLYFLDLLQASRFFLECFTEKLFVKGELVFSATKPDVFFL